MKGYKIFGCEGIHRKFYEYELGRENNFLPMSFEEMNDVIKLNPVQANTLATFGVVYLPFTSKEWANRYEIVIVNDYLCSALPEVFGNNEYYSGNVCYADNNKGHTKVLDRVAKMLKVLSPIDTGRFITYCCNPLRNDEEMEYITSFLSKIDESVEKVKSLNDLPLDLYQIIEDSKTARDNMYSIYHWTVCGINALIPFLIRNGIKYEKIRRCHETYIRIKNFEISYSWKGYALYDYTILFSDNYINTPWVRTPSIDRVEEIIKKIDRENVSDLKIFKEAV